MNDQMVFKLGMDIAQGLRDCHNAGIIHRDIKPENIFVNKAGNFKLGDFGVSRNAPGSQDVLSFKGTLGYMAPEVYKMQATDARSDIYSLGMVLYQCLNDNRLPFVPEDFTPYDIETARQRRLAGEPIPAPAHGSRRLKNLVLKAVEDRPEDRFQTAEEMYRALQKAYENDYNESVTLYQNTAPQPAKQITAAPDHYDGITVRNSTVAAPQEQYYSGQNIQDQNTQYQQSEKKPFPLITVVAAVAVVLTVIACVGILSLFIKKGDNAIDWKDAALEAKMREITGISFGNIEYSDVKDITELDLSNSGDAADDVKIKDISALSSMKELTSLNLSNNSISDISALGGLKNLTELYLGGNQISDISVLSGLTNLKLLRLTYNQISDISALGGLKNLTVLWLASNQISDISAIGGLTNLTELSLSENQISDISVLGGLKNLTELGLGINQISDISALGGLKNLTVLYLYKNQISDISAIGGLTNLTELYLWGNQISDISALGNLTNLTRLELASNEISNVSAIRNLTNLTDLRIGSNNISNINALGSLTSLTYLALNENSFSDISALGGLKNLTELYLNENQISDISPLSNLTNLTKLNIRNNPISDYSPIKDLNIEKLYK